MFPLIWQEDGLVDLDFILFELQFSRTVRYFLPCDDIHFIVNSQLIKDAEGEEDDFPEIWQAGIALLAKKKKPVISHDGKILFLPIWRESEIVASAVLDSGGLVSYEKYDLEWLHERSRLVSRELRRTKQWAFDPESGLLNGQSLREDLSVLLSDLYRSDPDSGNALVGSWVLFLVEVFPKARNSGQASADIARAGVCLKSFFGETVPLHHFGSGLFGLLWRSDDSEEFRQIGNALLSKLKRQNFIKSYIGIAPLDFDTALGEGDVSLGAADSLLARAWRSLKDAENLGPFAISSVMKGEASSLMRPPIASVCASLNKVWRGEAKFSVVLLQMDSEKGSGEFSKRISSLVGEAGTLWPENSREAYLYLPGVAGDEALCWLEKFKEKSKALGIGTFSMGVASFPCLGCLKKAEVPVNARKALLHTVFFGPDTVTVFDGVTLNISGDVYYNEGDLTGAVKEYQRGLRLDSENINLLNSLAVIYAQINRYKKAIPLFEKVLTLDPQNFMALFNLGFAFLRCSDLAGAASYFERALKVDDTYYDLLLQLGRIYCRLGRYRSAVKILGKAQTIGPVLASGSEGRPWQRSALPERTHAAIDDGLIYRYLGKAYQGVKNNREAISYLQKAIAYNPRDAETLSRLGELYLIEKQGDDIALSFCQQAINIDEELSGNWYRLAFVQEEMSLWADAINSLRHCLLLDRKNITALLLLAKVYSRLTRKKQASGVYEKVLRIDKTNKIAKKALQGRKI